MIGAKLQVIPAILTDNRAEFDRRLSFATEAAQSVHIDVIDGEFTSGAALSIEEWPKLETSYSEVHLMVDKPLDYLELLKAKKITRAIVHLESHFDVHELAVRARELDRLIGWAVNLDTDLSILTPYLAHSTYVQVMGVKPGASGQEQDQQAELAVRFLRSLSRYRITISVDGGVNQENATRLVGCGADYLVAASAIFGFRDWEAAFNQILTVARGPVGKLK